MGRNRFVEPEVVRLSLSDGDWIDVKKQLNAGETRKVFVRQFKSHEDKMVLDLDQLGRTRVVEYLLGWSFTGKNGEPVPYSEAALDNLDGDTYGEIVAAIDTHAEKVEKEIAEKKIAQSTGPQLKAISPSAA